MESYEAALVHVTNAQVPEEWVNCDHNDNGEVAYNRSSDQYAPADEIRVPEGYCTPVMINGASMCSEAECYEICNSRSCAEVTNYREFGQYPITVEGVRILVVTDTNVPEFMPLRRSGQVIERIGGVLKEFGPLDTPWIIEPRCPQDIYYSDDDLFSNNSDANVPIYQRCVPVEETGDYEDPY
jgi:hypothetical protein